MTNIHHPGTPLALMGAMSGMGGMPGYNHHPGLSPHHPHHLYVHHPGGPPPQSERPFKCTECQQAFNRNHDLKRHQRIHLEIKPYACEDCGKRFSRKDALKVSLETTPVIARALLTLFSAIDLSRDAAAHHLRRVPMPPLAAAEEPRTTAMPLWAATRTAALRR
jgi:hypothetical protein